MTSRLLSLANTRYSPKMSATHFPILPHPAVPFNLIKNCVTILFTRNKIEQEESKAKKIKQRRIFLFHSERYCSKIYFNSFFSFSFFISIFYLFFFFSRHKWRIRSLEHPPSIWRLFIFYKKIDISLPVLYRIELFLFLIKQWTWFVSIMYLVFLVWKALNLTKRCVKDKLHLYKKNFNSNFEKLFKAKTTFRLTETQLLVIPIAFRSFILS